MGNDDLSCFIYIQLPGTLESVPCASLKIRRLGGGDYEGTFTYGKRYLERPNVVALDPYHLPLTARPQKFTKLKGIPGAVRDASPDAWGRRVIQAKLHRAEADIEELEYLLNGPDDGAGNLSFGRTVTPPAPSRPFNRTHQLAALIEAAEKLERDEWLPHEVLEELEPGTSMGGARPKVTVEDNKSIWLAKLPERADRYNIQRVEFATLELARAAGLRVCRARLECVGGRDVLLLERFDREWNADAGRYWRYGLVSALTVLDAEDGYIGRPRWSYPLLADELRRWSSKSNDDRRELFRRMVFNAAVTNDDDHPRNHALLQTGGGWRLSPAFDIVPVSRTSLERRDLALEVGRYGRAASLYNLLSQADAFGLSVSEARAIFDSIVEAVRDWRTFFAERGVERSTIEALERAILPPSLFLEAAPAPV